MMRAGCIRRLRGIVSIVCLAWLAAACSTNPVVLNPPPNEAKFEYERVVAYDVDLGIDAVYDPWEGFNRRMYRFNAGADRWVLMPMVRGYRFVFPTAVRQGVSNVFDTIFGIRTFANQILQGRPVRATQTVGRVGVNLTLGVVGLFDVASRFGMPYHVEDFGQTMGVWGVGAGPYLVLPLAGPVAFQYFETGSPFEYELVRMMMSAKRKLEIER